MKGEGPVKAKLQLPRESGRDRSALSPMSGFIIDELPLLLLPALVALFFYVNLVRWKRMKRLNLPPAGGGWPFIGDTFAYLKPHLATSTGLFMEQHISR